MGGSYYERSVETASTGSTYSASAQAALSTASLQDGVRPAGRNLSTTADTPIVVAMDVTSSRGDDSKILYDKLPMFFGQLIMQQFAQDPSISFAAIGDATDGDKGPIQICDFAAGTALDEWLKKLWLEEGGGGSGKESYELTAYFYAFHSKLPEGKKGFFFITGDEGFYPKVNKDQIKNWIGDDLESDYDTIKVFEKLNAKYEVFFLFPKKSMEDKKSNIDAEISKRLAREGAKSGDVTVSLMWNNYSDCDLHVFTPSGEEISYSHKHSACGGELDVDMNAGGASSLEPVENVFWASGKAPKGTYRVYVQNYAYKGGISSPYPFTIKVQNGDKVNFYNGTAGTERQNIKVCEFEFTVGRTKKEGEKEVDKYAAYSDEVILADWNSVLPQERILILGQAKAIVDVMLGVVALSRTGLNLDGYINALKERGQDEERQIHVREALRAYAGKLGK